MFKQIHLITLSSVASLGLSSLAQAVPVTLTFEPFAGTSSVPEVGSLPSPFSQSGFDFTFNAGGTPEAPDGFFFIGAEAPCVSPCSSNGTAAFFNFNGSTLSLNRGDHGPFSLLRLDAAQTFINMGEPLELQIEGQLAGGGTVSALFSKGATGANSFSSFGLPSTFTDLVSVTFLGTSTLGSITQSFALDNVVVDPLPEKVVTPVPEPMSATLFGIGLLGCAMWGKRNRRA